MRGCWNKPWCPQQLSVSEEAGDAPSGAASAVLNVKPGAEPDFRGPTLAAEKAFQLLPCPVHVGGECGLSSGSEEQAGVEWGVLPVALASPLGIVLHGPFSNPFLHN